MTTHGFALSSEFPTAATKYQSEGIPFANEALIEIAALPLPMLVGAETPFVDTRVVALLASPAIVV